MMSDERVDPITLQVVAGALRAICEEMGAVLIHAAHSANIKERRDASTALFDARGEMVMQAAHIPVHLGAMPAAIAQVKGLEQRPGDVWILNDPFRGGTHLPDITLISPLFVEGELFAFAANRAHHADVGGSLPGSMPADSRTLADEGVVIAPAKLVAEGNLDGDFLARLTAQMRQPRQRVADLRAQLAAGELARTRVESLVARHGRVGIESNMDAVLDYAERRTRAAIAAMPDGRYRASDVLEDDAVTPRDLPIAVEIVVSGDDMTVDFTGSAAQTESNLNCPISVTRSAVYFAVRVLTDPDIPSCAGAYRPIAVKAPEHSLLNAAAPAAVVGGNVETSSRIADVVIAALGGAVDAPALGQGTMNNVTLGNDTFTYYETLAGGQGASSGGDGPSAVHVAMTNTLNTPIEALEREHPLRVTEYSIRRESGGSGGHLGGDGLTREFEALQQMTFALLTERRRHHPPGAAGGGPGQLGKNSLERAAGGSEPLAGKSQGTLEPGDRLRIDTPGGGGYGEPVD